VRQLSSVTPPRAMGLNPAILSVVRQGLKLVAQGGQGTASGVFSPVAASGGPVVAGKTGTAQSGQNGQADHSWFVGFAPVDDPRVAVCVFVENSGGDPNGQGGITAAPIARVTRSAMVEAMQSDYIRTAIAMGHGRRVVWFRYSLRNALLPVVTLIGGIAGHIFAGAVLLESIFAWPGLGQYALQAIERSDFAALQGFVIYASLLYVLAFLAVDILYMFIDPRMRT